MGFRQELLDGVMDLGASAKERAKAPEAEAALGAYPPELRVGLRKQYPGTTGGCHQRFPQGSPLVGLEQGFGDWPNITRRLLERGYAVTAVQQIIGGNLRRVFREVWRT